MLEKLEAIKRRFEDVEVELSSPTAMSDMKRFAQLNKEYKDSFDFGEDNLLLINGKRIAKCYWSIPKNEGEVDLYFKIISEEFNS